MDALIAGLWGTSRLQTFLIENGEVVDSRGGPGAAQISGRDFEAAFLALAGPWFEARPDARIILAGMVGSTLGWRDTGYVECPLRAEDAVRGGVNVTAGGRTARIVCGMACTNPMGEPDVLRGEEIEILGWQTLTHGAQEGVHVLCIPGTHAKWVILRDGRVESFLTSAAGALFAALGRDGILSGGGGDVHVPELFRGAVQDAAAPAASLIHLLFTPRARAVRGLMAPEHTASRLSGLIIGADVAGALRLIGEATPLSAPVTVIGMPGIGARYVDALDALGVPASLLESSVAAVAGFSRTAELLAANGARV